MHLILARRTLLGRQERDGGMPSVIGFGDDDWRGLIRAQGFKSLQDGFTHATCQQILPAQQQQDPYRNSSETGASQDEP